jgi:GNAT superfamily N-acetyltransferase
MYLVASFRTPLTDIGVDAGYISDYDINIHVAGSQEDFEKAGLCVPNETNDQSDLVADAGKAIVDRLHITLVDEGGDSLYDTCDADSCEWEAVFAGFLCEEGEQGFYKEIAETLDCYQRDVLLIRDISVMPEFQSRGLEMAVAERIIETLGSWCDLVVYNYGDHTNELKALEPMGFRPGPVEGYAFLNLNYSHPRVHPDGFCKFIALPADELVEM